MRFKYGVYFLLVLLIILESCGSAKKVIYFQSKDVRQGRVVDIPSYRLEKVVRFKPDDLLGITVNIPEEPSLAPDYNLPLVPIANQDNTSEGYVNQGMGRQSYLVKKDGTIDFPVLGNIKIEGFTRGELETFLKESIMKNITVEPVITARLQNFVIFVTGEVRNPGRILVDRDNINILEALAMADDMTLYAKRDDIDLFRRNHEGGYTRISLDISREDIISSEYFFLEQNDAIYVKQNNVRTQSASISPTIGSIIGISNLLMTAVTFILMLSRQ